MLKVRRLAACLIALGFALASLTPVSVANATGGCRNHEASIGCEFTKPGQDGDSGSSGNDSGNSGDGGRAPKKDRSGGGNSGDESDNYPPPGLICDFENGECGWTPPPAEDDPLTDDGGYVAPPIPSESDFISFDIPASIPYALPVDWTVTGKPTAFWADAGVKEFNEELLGFPIRIRATPIEYYWDFGDGNATVSKSPGREPAHPQYGTVTHAYSKKGERTVTLTTVYTGEYNYGTGWYPISGTAAVDSDGLPMTVYRYHKYRVEDDCLENPHGIDC